MARLWLTSAHLFLLLTLPSTALAQAGLQLTPPGDPQSQSTARPSRPALSLGRVLGAPSSEAVRLDRPTEPPVSLMPDGWALDVSALTSLPLSVGVDAQIQSPVGVFANLSVGHTPGAYLDMVATLLADHDVFGSEIQPLISEATRDGGWNVRLSVGVNPIEGLELSVGYTYVGASSALSVASIEAATGQRVRYPGMTEVPLSIEMHALHGRIGYRFLIEEHLVVRAAIGWTHAVAASVLVDVPEEVRALPDNPATEIEAAVDEGFDDYGFTPEVQLSVGYRF